MNYISSGCTKLSSLNRSQLVDYLLMVNKSEFLFRPHLDIDTLLSFGNEIEVNGIDLEKADALVYGFNLQHDLDRDKDKYVVHKELTADSEIVTPILIDTEENWDTFYDIYSMLRLSGATVGHNTAGHVHVGTHFINTPETLSLLLKMLVVFEPIIFKFGYGYDDTPRDFIRGGINSSCYAMMTSPKRYRTFISGLLKYNYKDKEKMDELFREFLAPDLEFRPVFNFNTFDFDKLHYRLSPTSPKDFDHFEVRCFNGTLDPAIAQNNINLVAHIVEAVLNDMVDKKYVEEEYRKYRKKTYDFDMWRAVIESEKEVVRYNRLLDGFSNVKLDKAIKLADMIFYSELDKIYFLKQYLKLFEVPETVVHRLVK